MALKLIVGILFKPFLVDSLLLKEYKNQLIELLKIPIFINLIIMVKLDKIF